ncbi:MAG: hypothetical protein ACOCZ7_00785 [Armatimonadota bacterium]
MGTVVAVCFLSGAGLLAALPTVAGYILIQAVAAKRRETNCWYYLGEQAAEIALLITLVSWLGESGGGAWLARFEGLPLQTLSVGLGLGFVWWHGAQAVGLLVQDISPSTELQRPQAGAPRAGELIGRLERTLIVFLVLANIPSGVGFLIAAKSILRFGEVTKEDNRAQAEYVIIGTLASFAFAIPVAYATVELLTWAQ